MTNVTNVTKLKKTTEIRHFLFLWKSVTERDKCDKTQKPRKYVVFIAQKKCDKTWQNVTKLKNHRNTLFLVLEKVCDKTIFMWQNEFIVLFVIYYFAKKRQFYWKAHRLPIYRGFERKTENSKVAPKRCCVQLFRS